MARPRRRDGDGRLRPADRVVFLACEHGQLRSRRVRHRELVAADRLEHVDGLRHLGEGLAASVRDPGNAARLEQRPSKADRIAEIPADGDGPLDQLGPHLGPQVLLVGPEVVVVGELFRREVVEVRLERSQVRHGLGVALHLRGPAGRLREEVHHGRAVSRFTGVVCTSGDVDAQLRARREAGQVQPAALNAGKRFLHRPTGELVAKGQGFAGEFQQPCGLAFGDRFVGVAEDLLDHREFGPAGNDRHELCQFPTGGRQAPDPADDHVPDRRWHRIAPRVDRLAHEERIPAGELPQFVTVALGAGEGGDAHG